MNDTPSDIPAGLDGRLVDEVPRGANESSRTYTGTGDDGGHLSLADARRWSLERVELAEAEVTEDREQVRVMEQVLQTAQKDYDAALADLRKSRVQLATARRDLAWRLGVAPLRQGDSG